MLTRWGFPAALLLLLVATGRAAVLPTNLEPRVGANYQPVGPDEIAIWQSLERLEVLIRNSPQRVISPELDNYTRGVVERLIGRAAPELRVYLMHDSSLNATILPSGMMIVNTGLLARVRNEAQLAAVLAHEAGHYFRRHSLDLHREKHRASEMAEASSLRAFESFDGNNSWTLLNQAIMLSTPRFSRNLESEADAYGLMLMARAGYPPSAASAIWRQVIDERRASADARSKRYRDGTNSVLSTHPPTEGRMANLADTAGYLAAEHAIAEREARDEWAEVIRPYRAMLLREQIQLNDPGASLYLLENLAKSDSTGLLRFNEGEIYRLRNTQGDDRKAAAAYAAATAFADAPPEAWRAHGFALLKAGRKPEADEALNRYLSAQPDAPDAALVRFMVANNHSAITAAGDGAGSEMTVNATGNWKKLLARKNQRRWEDVLTWNGPQIDRVTLVNGLPEGKALVFQMTDADQQVPVFRADMTAQDLVSMVEVSYRVNGVTAFEFESVEPVDFLGGAGVRLNYRYASGIVFGKKGACVMRIVDGKLYAMKLESLAGPGFETVSPEFDRLIASAALAK